MKKVEHKVICRMQHIGVKNMHRKGERKGAQNKGTTYLINCSLNRKEEEKEKKKDTKISTGVFSW